MDVLRGATLRAELGLPGLTVDQAAAYRDKLLMKRYAAAAGMRVPAFAPARDVADVRAFAAAHPGKLIVKPVDASGSTGVHVLDALTGVDDLAGELASGRYEVEEFIEGPIYHVDTVQVDGVRIAALPSRYTGAGCLSHLEDTGYGSRNLGRDEPLHDRLVAETWRLIEALPSPATLLTHAEFFVTADDEIVLCEIAARVAGGLIPEMLAQVLGIDPRHLQARVECGLPVDLDDVARRAVTAPRAGFSGLPPRHGTVIAVPEMPPQVVDHLLLTHVGDHWPYARYAARKSADFVASWVVVADDPAELDELMARTYAEIDAGLVWKPGDDR